MLRFFSTSKFFSPAHCRRQWKDWQQSILARSLADLEQRLLDDILKKKFGNELLQISMAGGTPLYERSPITNKTLLHFEYPVEGLGNAIVAQPEQLPIANEQMDLIILHHVLEYSRQPHQIIRDAQRALRSGGQLVITGFNPWSLWQLRKLLTLKRRAPWNGRYLSEQRLYDWLRLLDCKPEDTQFAFYGLPVGNQWLFTACRWLEIFLRRFNFHFGSCYVMVARKQIAGSIPLREPRRKTAILSFPLTEPTTRNRSD